MARVLKEEEHRAKRDAILDAAQKLVETIGYEQMAIQDLLNELKMSKGAFYHYFDSKDALLFALVERRAERVEQLLLPIVHDASLSGLDKLLRYFTAVDHWKVANKRLLLDFMRAWHSDENAIVRHRLYAAGLRRFVPLFAQIIRQGVAEGAFTTPYPEQAARMIICLRNDLGDAIAERILSDGAKLVADPGVARLTEATADALERVLGARPGCVATAWREALAQWEDALP